MKKNRFTEIASRIIRATMVLGLTAAMAGCFMPGTVPTWGGGNGGGSSDGRAGQARPGGGTYDSTGYGGYMPDGRYTDDLDYSMGGY